MIVVVSVMSGIVRMVSERSKSMLMQISHNDFDGKDYIQVIQSGCVILEVPLVKEQEHEIN